MRRYQKNANVVGRKITEEYRSINKILSLLPAGLKLIDIACAECFIGWLAKAHGLDVTGIELDMDKVKGGKQHLGMDIIHGSIFDNYNLLKGKDVFVVSRFFHNIGFKQSGSLMRAIDKNKDYIIIVKYKPGAYRETGQKRQPLATKKGVGTFLGNYKLNTKAFRSEVIVGAKGKYREIPDMLRKYLGEPK